MRAVSCGQGSAATCDAQNGQLKPHSDPVAQMLSAALVGTEEHQAVRDRLGEAGRG
jgi:hypothetical protein